MTANRLIAALALLGALAAPLAQAQTDDTPAPRRKAGHAADRDSKVAVPSTTPRPAARAAHSETPTNSGGRAIPGSSVLTRQKPGAATPVKPGGATAAPAQPEETGGESPRFQRPGQPLYNEPGTQGERPAPSAPAQERVQLDTNHRSGLTRIDKPAADAIYRADPVADRSTLTEQLGLTDHPIYDPYHQNTLKGDRPLYRDWYFSLGLISDSLLQRRYVPTPVGGQAEIGAGHNDVIGDGNQYVLAQTLTTEMELFQGDTTFKPPIWRLRAELAYNYNHSQVRQAGALRVDPSRGRSRDDDQLGVQQLFVERYLRTASVRYDFDSLRLGIQPFTSDFRGFLFRDEALGARLFGTRDNNRWQYNLAALRRIEKDTNSELNDLGKALRHDDVILANLYRQDFPRNGFTSQAIALFNRNHEGRETYYDNNGFLARPSALGLEEGRDYSVVYLGYNGDGHFERLNLSGSAYYAIGHDSRSVFAEGGQQIRAWFAAAEASVDFDWRRVRLSLLYASPDRNPYDHKETGFDAVAEKPQFVGGDSSYWIGQAVPLIGGGGVTISSVGGILNSLRSSGAEGQSNFTNPGTMLIGLGADFDLLPVLRISVNANQVWFADSRVVEVARAQAPIARAIGEDLSVAASWRPFFTQNIVLRASGAVLLPEDGWHQLYGDKLGYAALLNLILAY